MLWCYLVGEVTRLPRGRRAPFNSSRRSKLPSLLRRDASFLGTGTFDNTQSLQVAAITQDMKPGGLAQFFKST
ncbi:hypothetical protein AHMF7605_21435 [Adhaeribacter arboris]|uniref:Uncharacterized protein n=1 Tax=Adhaeribacter arboris TaxID=2072846 RepID=A0A2T2YK63_9BACT|nr:hypothetical protein [Adhaeribacter arboris]PSR55879.1 hypothetical protein AHMF7605_21435 [Adhaeribacter arboris]